MVKDDNLNRREFLAAAAALVAGLSLPGRFLRAEDLEIKLGEPTTFPLHPGENRDLIKNTVQCAPNDNNTLMYDEFVQNKPLPQNPLSQLGRHVFLNVKRDGENIQGLETCILKKDDFKEYFNQEDCLPGGFVWQKQNKNLAGYVSYRSTMANQNTIFYIEFSDFQDKPKIKSLGSVDADNNFFSIAASSLDDLALWDNTSKTITLMSAKGLIAHLPTNNQYLAQSKAVWNHSSKRSSQLISYFATEKETGKRGMIFYKPQTKGFKFQPINLGGKYFELVHDLVWDHQSNRIYLETDSSLMAYHDGQVQTLDQGDFQTHPSPLIVNPNHSGVFYFKREEGKDDHQNPKITYSICNATQDKTSVLAKPHYLNGLSIDSAGKFLYGIESNPIQKYFLASRSIKKA